MSPLMKMRSALLSSSAAWGSGSKVWELVPSGTIPSIVTLSPATAETIEVSGETVVATMRPELGEPLADSGEAVSELPPQALSARVAAAASDRAAVREPRESGMP